MNRRAFVVIALSLAAIAIVFLYMRTSKPQSPQIPADAAILSVASDFPTRATISPRYTCDGEDIPPPLSVSGIPETAKTLALIMDDPDSPTGTWVHWLVFDITATSSAFGTKAGEVPVGTPGLNSWGKTGYGGPCPGSGNHRYYFKIYALDSALGLPPGSDKKTLEAALSGHIVGYGELTGRYERGR